MEAGTILDSRFRIQARAGEGGMGIVYRAEELSTGKSVAIKVMHNGGEADRARFAREADVLSRLSYPTIVGCLGRGHLPSGEPWMAMDWIEGEDLATRLDKGPLHPHDALHIIRALAGALQAAHSLGIVHRDLKPANIILENGDPTRARLIDFGVARIRESHSFTEFGTVLGTPAYMAPEQIRGANEVDEKADLYALGVILFECVTGRTPFLSPTLLGVMTQALFEVAPRIRSINASLSPALETLVDSLLEKEPSRRLGPASVLLEALESPDLTHFDAAPAPASRPLGLTADEMIMVSVVFVSREGARPASINAETVMDRTEGQLIRAIERLATPFHGRVEGFRDGTVIVAFPARGSATDQAGMAARTALAIRDLGTGLPITLATGRANAHAESPYSAAAERAATLIKKADREISEILIDETTRGLLDTRFSVEQRLGTFYLLAEDAFGDAGRLLCGVPAPFVGREREIALLERLFDNVIQEPQSAAAIVVGEAGVGKSRLGREVLAMLTRLEPQTEIWVARAEAVRAGSAFEVLASLLRRQAGILEDEELDIRRQKLAKFVQQRMPASAAESTITFLGEIVETNTEDTAGNAELSAARHDPVLMRDRIRYAFEDLVDSVTEKHPLVLMLEDLHWGDMPSIKLLELIHHRLRLRPFFVLAFGRPELLEQFPNLFSEWAPSTIRLAGLSQRACQNLITRILGARVSTETIASMVARSAGHPLFLEELVRAVAESSSSGANALPETIVAMMQSRMAKLAPEARLVLRAASVFGEIFWADGVKALLGSVDSAPDVGRWLRFLQEREFVELKRTSRFASQQEYRFRHALVRESAYAMLTDVDAATGHLLAGTFLEENGESNAALLASHFDLARDATRAAPYHLRAGREALLGGDFQGVFLHADRIINASVEQRLMGEVLALKADARQWMGEFEQAGELAEQALERLDPGSDVWFGAAMTLAVVSARRIRTERLRNLCTTLIQWGAAHEWTDAYIEAAIRVGLQAHVIGQYSASQELIAPLTRLLENTSLRGPRIQALLELLQAARSAVGWRYDKTIYHSLEAARLFERLGDSRAAAGQRLDASFTLVDLGMLERAVEICKDLIVIADRLNIPRLKSISMGLLGSAYVALGQLDEARSILLEAKSLLDASGDARNGGSVRYKLGRCLRLQKEFDGALRFFDESEQILAALPRARAMCHANKSTLLIDMGRNQEALDQASKGMQLLAELGRIGTDEILVRYAYVESLKLNGRLTEAQKELTIAKERVDWMANQLTDAAARETFLTRVDENVRIIGMEIQVPSIEPD